MRILTLPSKEIRKAISQSKEVQHRKEQSNSKNPETAKYGQAWLNGFYYGIELMTSSYGPDEAQAAYLMLKQITDNLNDMLKQTEWDLKDVKNSKKYYFNEE